MDFAQNVMEKVSTVSSTEHEFCTIIATVRKFSNEYVHLPNQSSPEFIDYEIRTGSFSYRYPLTICANGTDSVNDGYVTLIFQGEILNVKNLELACIVGVVDREGSKRFLRSFTFSCDLRDSSPYGNYQWPRFVIDKYLARRTLLNEPAELLPNDILTLHIEIHLVEHFEVQSTQDLCTNLVKTSFKTEKHPDGIKYYLYLHSLVAVCLREESTYFQRILDNPMTERNTRFMNVPAEEYQTFIEVACILRGATSIKVESVGDIFRFYYFADKYDIPAMVGICRDLLKSVLTLDNVSDFDDRYGSDNLRETIAIFLKDTDFLKENKIEGDKKYSKVNGWNTEWSCEHVIGVSKSYLYFRQEVTVSSDSEEEDAFDFYH